MIPPTSPRGLNISSMSLEVRQLNLVAGGTWGMAAEIKNATTMFQCQRLTPAYTRVTTTDSLVSTETTTMRSSTMISRSYSSTHDRRRLETKLVPSKTPRPQLRAVSAGARDHPASPAKNAASRETLELRPWDVTGPFSSDTVPLGMKMNRPRWGRPLLRTICRGDCRARARDKDTVSPISTLARRCACCGPAQPTNRRASTLTSWCGRGYGRGVTSSINIVNLKEAGA